MRIYVLTEIKTGKVYGTYTSPKSAVHDYKWLNKRFPNKYKIKGFPL